MIALAITLAFVACVASFTALRLRRIDTAADMARRANSAEDSIQRQLNQFRRDSESLTKLRAMVEDIGRDIDAIEEMATEAKATAQSAANAVAVRKR